MARGVLRALLLAAVLLVLMPITAASESSASFEMEHDDAAEVSSEPAQRSTESPLHTDVNRCGKVDVLTTRESQVAQAASLGKSNREIALTLRISERTVESHLLRIYRKLGVRSRTQLALVVHNVVS